MKYFSHLNTAVQLLQQYNGKQPFGNFIKQYFAQHKKYGSKDRKNISQLCYASFRTGKALPHLSIEERILTGLFLCATEPNELLQNLKPEWNATAHLSVKQKLDQLGIPFNAIFPWQQELSEGIDYEQFSLSFFTQPDLFLRLRPGFAQTARSKLQQAGISFTDITNTCIALPNTSKIDTLIETDKEAVVQDYSSQRVGEFMELVHASGTSDPSTSLSNSQSAPSTMLRDHKSSPSTALRVWDACAASGGKSILANDVFGQIDLTVTDIRESILINLKKRFTVAGIKNWHPFVIDLSASAFTRSTFDLIITDVPCSGSGTWSRTPEQLYYFNAAEINRYSSLQKKIIHNVVPQLKPGGWLLYCTCSVFKKENEEMVQLLQQQYGLQLHKMELLKGYDQKADTLFAALFTSAQQ